MKIAVSGKGGSGKTLFAATLGLIFAENKKTYIIDADSDGNLGITVGFNTKELQNIKPISELKELIKERTGDSKGFYKLAPEVSDIPEKYSLKKGNLSLIVLGVVKKAESGCYCSENTFLKTLLSHLILKENEVVIIDMPAGIEHLTRGTAKAITQLYVMVEPTAKSIQTAQRVIKLAKDLEIPSIILVGNKIKNEVDKNYILENNRHNVEFFIDYDDKLNDFEQGKISLHQTSYYQQLLKYIRTSFAMEAV